ncbi:hypothetical protein N6H14_25110 [Paenibacillus sp. CC-CFT747]|nr:hypothetical protein N6H14_25110 [Paenibacillus sp. CC-CFT747]
MKPTKPKRGTKSIAAVSLGIMGAGFLATLPVNGTVWGALLQGALRQEWSAGWPTGSP